MNLYLKQGARLYRVELDYVFGIFKLDAPRETSEEISLDHILGHSLGSGNLKIAKLPGATTMASKIVVLRSKDLYVGILSDSLTTDAQDTAFDDLDTRALIENFGSGILTENSHTESTEEGYPYLLVDTQNGSLAVDMKDVVEVSTKADMVPAILVSERSCGYLRSRDILVPVLHFFDKDDESDAIVIQRSSSGDLFGFPVKRVVKLRSFRVSDLLEGQVSDEAAGLCKIFQLSDYIDSQELQEILDGYKNIYSAKAGGLHQESSEYGAEGAYLEFKIGDSLTVPLMEVQEICLFQNVEKSDSMNSEVGNMDFHGQQIPVFDGRRMYGFEVSDIQSESCRIIVIKKQNLFFGVVVDAVLGILRVDMGTELALNRWLLSGYSNSFRNDIVKFVNVMDVNHQGRINLKVTAFQEAANLIKIAI